MWSLEGLGELARAWERESRVSSTIEALRDHHNGLGDKGERDKHVDWNTHEQHTTPYPSRNIETRLLLRKTHY